VEPAVSQVGGDTGDISWGVQGERARVQDAWKSARAGTRPVVALSPAYRSIVIEDYRTSGLHAPVHQKRQNALNVNWFVANHVLEILEIPSPGLIESAVLG
jgi:hypothetical protein